MLFHKDTSMHHETSELIKSGIRLKCGACEKGSLFRSYLKFYDSCPNCGLDLTVADTADGPAFFVGFFTMIVITPLILVAILSFDSWIAKAIAFIIGILTGVIVCLLLLPPVKAILLNLQIEHNSGEGSVAS